MGDWEREGGGKSREGIRDGEEENENETRCEREMLRTGGLLTCLHFESRAD